MADGHAWQGACVVGGMYGRGACMTGTAFVAGGMHGGREGGGRLLCVAEETATAVDGTHSTGMHSCLILISLLFVCQEIQFYRKY